MMASIEKSDPQIFKLIKQEGVRIRSGLELIPSENYASKAVLQTLGTFFNCKYSEGYAKKRYYGGNEFIDGAEILAIERAKKLFKVPHANVQPYSGSPANLAVYFAICKPGDTIMGHNLLDGGHLTHGWKASFSGQYFKSIQYHVKKDGYLDIEGIKELAEKHKPKLIWVGGSAYAREYPFEQIAKIADSVGAYLIADIAHVAGLVCTGLHADPEPHVHIITTTTHKTLRGPRGGMIMVTKKGLDKDPDLAKKIDKAIFPGLQGGPHDNQTAAIAVALGEASKPEFKVYANQIIKNSKALAESLKKNDIKLVTDGTDNHMLLIDLTPFGIGIGVFVQDAMEESNLTANKNTIPFDPSSPFYPSGMRLGTPAITTLGMKEKEMEKIGNWITEVIKEVKDFELPKEKEERKEYLNNFRKSLEKNKNLQRIKKEVENLCKNFPLYDFDILGK
tara:strand:+ start:58075 stop:59421 length:1347 start_codon:yes stop_codon:yes gene_type:complete